MEAAISDPNTTNVALLIPTRGSDVGVWDLPVNGDFNAIDGFFGGVQTISVSNANVTLTAPSGSITPTGGPTQAQNAVIRFTGVLTAGVQVTLPLPGYMIVENLTTGAFVLSFRAIGSGQVIGIEQGVVQRVYNDGTNVRFVNLQTVGSYLDICDATVPAWITACTVPPFLNCDGTTFNATTYPYLNGKLGGNTLPDLRGVSRYTLNQGTSRLTSAGSGLDGNTRFASKFTQTQTLVTQNLPPYTPAGTSSPTGVATWDGNIVTINNPSSGGTAAAVPNANHMTGNNTESLTGGTPQGGTSTPFGLIGTGTVSGITLIRAA